MAYKGLAFATATVFAMLTAAHAGPVEGIALNGGASITKVDYYYPGDYYAEPSYPSRGFADVPRDVIGGALGAVSGAIDGALHGPRYYAPPYYGPGYGPYYSGFEDSPESACQRDFPGFDPATGTYVTEDGAEFLCPYIER